jgi:uncharacterized membrane protein YeiB
MMMLFQRFTLICLLSMLFGIGFATIVQAQKSDRRTAIGEARSCSSQFHPVCNRSSYWGE